MKKKLIIIGASGHGKVCVDIANKMNKWDQIYFLDDNPFTKECLGYEVLGTSKEIDKYQKEADFFVAVGDNNTREEVLNNLIDKKCSIAILIHPNAIINSFVDIGVGTVIMAGVVINSDTNIGIGCIINTSSSIDHDNNIENYVHISPGVHLAGNVSVGKGSWLGINTTVIQNIYIHTKTQIGASSLVISNIVDSGVYIGAPAKKLK